MSSKTIVPFIDKILPEYQYFNLTIKNTGNYSIPNKYVLEYNENLNINSINYSGNAFYSLYNIDGNSTTEKNAFYAYFTLFNSNKGTNLGLTYEFKSYEKDCYIYIKIVNTKYERVYIKNLTNYLLVWKKDTWAAGYSISLQNLIYSNSYETYILISSSYNWTDENKVNTFVVSDINDKEQIFLTLVQPSFYAYLSLSLSEISVDSREYNYNNNSIKLTTHQHIDFLTIEENDLTDFVEYSIVEHSSGVVTTRNGEDYIRYVYVINIHINENNTGNTRSGNIKIINTYNKSVTINISQSNNVNYTFSVNGINIWNKYAPRLVTIEYGVTNYNLTINTNVPHYTISSDNWPSFFSQLDENPKTYINENSPYNEYKKIPLRINSQNRSFEYKVGTIKFTPDTEFFGNEYIEITYKQEPYEEGSITTSNDILNDSYLTPDEHTINFIIKTNVSAVLQERHGSSIYNSYDINIQNNHDMNEYYIDITIPEMSNSEYSNLILHYILVSNITKNTIAEFNLTQLSKYNLLGFPNGQLYKDINYDEMSYEKFSIDIVMHSKLNWIIDSSSIPEYVTLNKTSSNAGYTVLRLTCEKNDTGIVRKGINNFKFILNNNYELYPFDISYRRINHAIVSHHINNGNYAYFYQRTMNCPKGETITLKIYSNTSWKLSSNAKPFENYYFTSNKSSGTGDDEIQITINNDYTWIDMFNKFQFLRLRLYTTKDVWLDTCYIYSFNETDETNIL